MPISINDIVTEVEGDSIEGMNYVFKSNWKKKNLQILIYFLSTDDSKEKSDSDIVEASHVNEEEMRLTDSDEYIESW